MGVDLAQDNNLKYLVTIKKKKKKPCYQYVTESALVSHEFYLIDLSRVPCTEKYTYSSFFVFFICYHGYSFSNQVSLLFGFTLKPLNFLAYNFSGCSAFSPALTQLSGPLPFVSVKGYSMLHSSNSIFPQSQIASALMPCFPENKIQPDNQL